MKKKLCITGTVLLGVVAVGASVFGLKKTRGARENQEVDNQDADDFDDRVLWVAFPYRGIEYEERPVSQEVLSYEKKAEATSIYSDGEKKPYPTKKTFIEGFRFGETSLGNIGHYAIIGDVIGADAIPPKLAQGGSRLQPWRGIVLTLSDLYLSSNDATIGTYNHQVTLRKQVSPNESEDKDAVCKTFRGTCVSWGRFWKQCVFL